MLKAINELEKVANIASNVYGVQKVVSHVKISDMIQTDKSKGREKEKEVKEVSGKFIDDDKVTVVEPASVEPVDVQEDNNVNQSVKDDW